MITVTVDPKELRKHLFTLESLCQMEVLLTAQVNNPRTAHQALVGAWYFFNELERFADELPVINFGL